MGFLRLDYITKQITFMSGKSREKYRKEMNKYILQNHIFVKNFKCNETARIRKENNRT